MPEMTIIARAAGHVRPRRPGIHLVLAEGRHGRAGRPLVEAWVSMALASGRVVHWVDGASRLDPGRMIPYLRHLGRGPRDLQHLHVARGFTAHQYASLVARLAGEVEASGAALVVLDAPTAMLDDPEVGGREGRDLVRHLCHDLLDVVARSGAVVLVVGARHGTARQQWRTARLASVATDVLTLRGDGRDGVLDVSRNGAGWTTVQIDGRSRLPLQRQPTLSCWTPEGLEGPAKGAQKRPSGSVQASEVDLEVQSREGASANQFTVEKHALVVRVHLHEAKT